MQDQVKKMTRLEAVAQLTAAGQPYEIQQVEVRGEQEKVFTNAEATLRELFASTRSDETFYVYEDERYSFNEMYIGAAKIAHSLVERHGVEPGDRIAISMRNYPEWVMTFTAITSIGAIAVAMNALWGADEMEYGLEHCGAKLIFADQERLVRLAELETLDIQVVAVRPQTDVQQGVHLISDMLQAAEVEMPPVDFAPDDDATILYTSGSTGHPKGAVSSHRNVLSALWSWELDGQSSLLINNAEPPEREFQVATLLGVPLFHVAGSHAVLLQSYRAQRKVVAMYKWDVERATDLIESEKIATFIAPAAMTGDLVEASKSTNRDLSSLVMVGGGGAPRAPEQVKGIDESFTNAIPNTGWGMTETNAIGSGIAGLDYLAHPRSSGQCSAVLELAIVDEAGNHLTDGERGELLIRGTSVIRGYWNRPEANESSFTNGWFRTGDVATIDEEGFLYIVDRIKDLVIRGGENIGCGEVEAALVEHPNVLEATVYGVPDERLGEEIGATIYVNQAVVEDELKGFLTDHLAKFKIPKYIEMTQSSLPRIASGKINKRQLRVDALAVLGIQED